MMTQIRAPMSDRGSHKRPRGVPRLARHRWRSSGWPELFHRKCALDDSRTSAHPAQCRPCDYTHRTRAEIEQVDGTHVNGEADFAAQAGRRSWIRRSSSSTSEGCAALDVRTAG